MKKRFLAIILVLVLSAGLTSPAFAANESASSAPQMDIVLPDNATSQSSTSTYQLRAVSSSKLTATVDGEAHSAYVIVRNSEPEAFPLDVIKLPLGTTITVNNLRNDWGNESGTVNIVGVQAYSDPDGDGVYDQWIYNFDNKPPVVPLTEDMVSWPPEENNGKYSYQAYFTKDNGLESDVNVLPSSVTFSTDYLNEVFGPNTLVLIQLQVWTAFSTDPLTAIQTGSSGTAAFLITGEKAADTTNTPSFTDVPADAYYAAPVAWAVEKEITARYLMA